ncbi:MAG: DUF1320 domain-containing protein [Cyanobacteria bacterium P01_A01_bin.17]
MYATAQDMIDRFGLTEMLRLSRPEERDAEAIDEPVIDKAISDATAIIDGYLRGRYHLPLANPPQEIIRATCHLARYDLADTGRSEPSDQMTGARKETIAWLKQIANTEVRIDAPAPNSSGNEPKDGGARISDRKPAMTNDSLRGW